MFLGLSTGTGSSLLHPPLQLAVNHAQDHGLCPDLPPLSSLQDGAQLIQMTHVLHHQCLIQKNDKNSEEEIGLHWGAGESGNSLPRIPHYPSLHPASHLTPHSWPIPHSGSSLWNKKKAKCRNTSSTSANHILCSPSSTLAHTTFSLLPLAHGTMNRASRCMVHLMAVASGGVDGQPHDPPIRGQCSVSQLYIQLYIQLRTLSLPITYTHLIRAWPLGLPLQF